MSQRFPVSPGPQVLQTGALPIAAGSDSIYCGEMLLQRGRDYTINLQTGQISFAAPPPCDSVTVVTFRLPPWLAEPVGNPVPQGKRLLSLGSTAPIPSPPSGPASRQITLSGSKSFAFTVGRSGEGHFSQGLNLDFDAHMADDLRLRGSISDRIGDMNQLLAGGGGTAILSELDQYFFEIQGRRITARGGDVETVAGLYLPPKRIKGMFGRYATDRTDLAVDLGRPAGKFVSQKIAGLDGRQGPYQAAGSDGLPTGVVPGTEKVYVDGNPLEGGSDRMYTIDYPSGRITFSPRVLITSRSRIEIDFEGAATDYQQVVYDAAAKIGGAKGKIRFSAGGRRESDDKEQLRFGSLTSADISLLQAAGDSAARAVTDGVVLNPQGPYALVTDSTRLTYYQYVGPGAGGYDVSFSYLGEGKGEYSYLGEGVYQYVGVGRGGYRPVRMLPLPGRNDFFFSTVELLPYPGAAVKLEYTGNIHDRNLFSSLDDGDNFTSQAAAQIIHADSTLGVAINGRFRQQGYQPAFRVDRPDDSRLWALPRTIPVGDELRLESNLSWTRPNNRIALGGGYVSYRDILRAQRLHLAATFLADKAASPYIAYQTAQSNRLTDTGRDGLYENIDTGLRLKPASQVRFDFNVTRELVKDRFTDIPDVEKFIAYRGAAFFRNSVLTVSRRIDFQSAFLGTKGPQLDKIEFLSEESVGRVDVTMAATWLDQKKLDSDRGSRTENLYVTSLRYAAPDGWLTIHGEYRQNRQSVRALDYRYVQVQSGEGQYRFEDGQYLIDPGGDYIRVREERGEATSVSVGGKSHTLFCYPGRMRPLARYEKILSQIALRVRTEVNEELPGKDRRTWTWMLPWFTPSGRAYVARDRREEYAALLFPMFNFYLLNLAYAGTFEERQSGQQLFRDRKQYVTEVKCRLSAAALGAVKWEHNRAHESGIGLASLKLTGNTGTMSIAVQAHRFQVTPQVSYLRLADALSGGRGHGIILGVETIRRDPGRGEIRCDLAVRSLTEESPFSQPEYLITGGIRFGRSASATLNISHDLGKALRLTVNLTDRIYEGRPAEFVGRGELVATF